MRTSPGQRGEVEQGNSREGLLVLLIFPVCALPNIFLLKLLAGVKDQILTVHPDAEVLSDLQRPASTTAKQLYFFFLEGDSKWPAALWK